MTSKQVRIVNFVRANPGCSTADVHRAIGGDYAHGHHRFTYDSVYRLLNARRYPSGLVTGPSRGNTGTLYTRDQLRALNTLTAVARMLGAA